MFGLKSLDPGIHVDTTRHKPSWHSTTRWPPFSKQDNTCCQTGKNCSERLIRISCAWKNYDNCLDTKHLTCDVQHLQILRVFGLGLACQVKRGGLVNSSSSLPLLMLCIVLLEGPLPSGSDVATRGFYFVWNNVVGEVMGQKPSARKGFHYNTVL